MQSNGGDTVGLTTQQFRSVIVIDGQRNTLPPCMTTARREEMSMYRILATEIQKRLAAQHPKSSWSSDAAATTSVSARDVTDSTTLLKQAVRLTTPSSAQQKKQPQQQQTPPHSARSVGTASDLASTTINEELPTDSDRPINSSRSISSSTTTVRPDVSSISLIRSNSFTVDTPSEMLQLHWHKLKAPVSVTPTEKTPSALTRLKKSNKPKKVFADRDDAESYIRKHLAGCVRGCLLRRFMRTVKVQEQIRLIKDLQAQQAHLLAGDAQPSAKDAWFANALVSQLKTSRTTLVNVMANTTRAQMIEAIQYDEHRYNTPRRPVQVKQISSATLKSIRRKMYPDEASPSSSSRRGGAGGGSPKDRTNNKRRSFLISPRQHRIRPAASQATSSGRRSLDIGRRLGNEQNRQLRLAYATNNRRGSPDKSSANSSRPTSQTASWRQYHDKPWR